MLGFSPKGFRAAAAVSLLCSYFSTFKNRDCELILFTVTILLIYAAVFSK